MIPFVIKKQRFKVRFNISASSNSTDGESEFISVSEDDDDTIGSRSTRVHLLAEESEPFIEVPTLDFMEKRYTSPSSSSEDDGVSIPSDVCNILIFHLVAFANIVCNGVEGVFETCCLENTEGGCMMTGLDLTGVFNTDGGGGDAANASVC